MSERVVLWVRPWIGDLPDWRWMLSGPLRSDLIETIYDGEWPLCFATKREALAEGRRVCRGLWRELSLLAQLRWTRLNGTFEDEHTYGKDPRRTPG